MLFYGYREKVSEWDQLENHIETTNAESKQSLELEVRTIYC